MSGSSVRSAIAPSRGRLAMWLLAGAIAAFGLSILTTPALAGQASSGELLFYPCSSCHPIGDGLDMQSLPNAFEGHSIALDGHDALGEGSVACLACHDDPAVDPGMLKLADGTLIDIQGDVSQVCYQCHSDKYSDFLLGIHGHLRSGCTDAGCHDPHSPRWIYAEPLLPFIGTGFQFRAIDGRETFRALAPPAPAPAVDTPGWFTLLATVGTIAGGGQALRLVSGRQKR